MVDGRIIEPLIERLYASVLDGLQRSTLVDALADEPSDALKTHLAAARTRPFPTVREQCPYPAAIEVDVGHEHGLAALGASALKRRLERHFNNADAIRERLEGLRCLAEIYRHVLDCVGIGIVLTNERGTCLFSNTMARRLLVGSDGVFIAHGRLTASNRADQQKLGAMIVNAARADTTPDSRLQLHAASGRCGRILAVGPLRPALPINNGGVASVVVFAHEVVPRPMQADRILKELFHFTPAESALALALFECGDLAEACRSQRKSLATGRVQLRSLMEKTGCHRQNALFRILAAALSLPDSWPPANSPDNPFG